MSGAGLPPRRILVWDVPTRLFHWALVISFVGAFVTADSERHRDLHVVFGVTMLVLIAFRLVWGVIGTRYARFAAFTFGPRAVLRYLASVARHAAGAERRGSASPSRHLGHPPAGAWAIWLMLASGALVGVTGWAVHGDIGGDSLEDAHAALAWTLLAVVGVHVAGVLLSSALHRENLVEAMITGRKRGQPHEGIAAPRWFVGAALAALILALWLGLVPLPGMGPGTKLTDGTGASAANAEDD
jgi:cytochrome b